MKFRLLITAFAFTIISLLSCTSKEEKVKQAAADKKVRVKEDDKSDSLLLVYNPKKEDKWIAEFANNLHKKYGFNGNRGVSGHSLGGYLVADLMFKAPEMFNRFGINSSSQRLHLNNEIRSKEKNYAATHKEYNAKVFLSFGSLEPKDAIEDLHYFDKQLTSHYQGIETKFVEFSDETHLSVLPAMLSRCMWYLYKKN